MRAATLLLLFAVSTTPALAAPGKDAKGKFIKWPPPAAPAGRCRSAKGAFVKCGTPGAVPA